MNRVLGVVLVTVWLVCAGLAMGAVLGYVVRRRTVMVGVLALIGVIFLVLAGLNVAAERFSPGWFGLAFVSAAFLWANITHLAG